MLKTRQYVSGTLALLLLILIITSALWAAFYIREDTTLQLYVAQFGYGGIFLLSIIAGLNVLVPIPAASLVPIFTIAGLYLPGIVLSLTLGTLVADYIGYKLGSLSSQTIISRYPKVFSFLSNIYTKHHQLVIPIVFLYAAFVPFPNEVLILPLAILKMKFRYLLLPLFLGDFVNQAIFAYGMQNIFWWLF